MTRPHTHRRMSRIFYHLNIWPFKGLFLFWKFKVWWDKYDVRCGGVRREPRCCWCGCFLTTDSPDGQQSVASPLPSWSRSHASSACSTAALRVLCRRQTEVIITVDWWTHKSRYNDQLSVSVIASRQEIFILKNTDFLWHFRWNPGRINLDKEIQLPGTKGEAILRFC